MAATHRSLVYRVRRLPEEVVSCIEAASFLGTALHLPSSDVHICSLATVTPSPWSPATRTATAMFETVPQVIHDEPSSDEWVFRHFDTKKTMLLDSHFRGLTPLNDIIAPHKHEFNCIAISGLASHPFGSWQPKRKERSFMWLRDTLPDYHPTVRVWLYGYDTSLEDGTSFQSIQDLSISLINQLTLKEHGLALPTAPPIMFIAHSLGGIVLKQALTRLGICGSQDMHLLQLTRGAVLLGVPNLGMEQTHLEVLVKGQHNSSLIRDLAVDSPYLWKLNEQFFGHGFNQKMRLFWGYETRSSKTAVINPDGIISRSGPDEILVTRESATSNLVDKNQDSTFPIHENHSNMVKFSEDDVTCKIVLDRLEQIMGHPIPVPQPRAKSADAFPTPKGWPRYSTDNSKHTIPNSRDVKLQSVPPEDITSVPVDWLISSLEESELEQRLQDIENRSQHTFEWIFEDHDLGFTTWLHSGADFYWISGKPASGKSTLLKFIVQDPRMTKLLGNLKLEEGPIIATFFFHHRGSALQKSLEGLMRSILVQMLKQRHELAVLFNPIFEASCGTTFPIQDLEKKEQFKPQLERFVWTERSIWRALQFVLHQRIFELSVCCFFDALDEYDGTPEVVSNLLDNMLQESHQGKTTLKICFTSRPWEVFIKSFQSYPGIRIHEHTESDIRKFCYHTIDLEPSVNILKHLVPDVINNANGVFLWAKLALSDLSYAADSVKTVEELRKILRDLPKELHVYYEEIVARCPTNLREKAYALMELVTRSYKPLLVSQALLILSCSDFTNYEMCQASIMSTSPEAKIISIACGGLLELNQDRVQLMHQTVREFVLRPQFKTLILRNLAKFQHENGHSFTAKAMFTSLGDRDTKSLLRHCKAAELTTGKSQIDFLRSVPERWFESHGFGPSMARHGLLLFAVAGGLHLCIRELLPKAYQAVLCRQDALMQLILTFDSIRFDYDDLEVTLTILNQFGFQIQAESIMSDYSYRLVQEFLRVRASPDFVIARLRDPTVMLFTAVLGVESNPTQIFRSLTDPQSGDALHICNPEPMNRLLALGMDPSAIDQWGRSLIDYPVLFWADSNDDGPQLRLPASWYLEVLGKGGRARESSMVTWQVAPNDSAHEAETKQLVKSPQALKLAPSAHSVGCVQERRKQREAEQQETEQQETEHRVRGCSQALRDFQQALWRRFWRVATSTRRKLRRLFKVIR
ncbi:hypothetical protein F5Y10DRAFT_278419 [Nemania abortiva]|nr:hypothetical protein F5Y10DRAFT_278419 [Nemania abortiva]